MLHILYAGLFLLDIVINNSSCWGEWDLQNNMHLSRKYLGTAYLQTTSQLIC